MKTQLSIFVLRYTVLNNVSLAVKRFPCRFEVRGTFGRFATRRTQRVTSLPLNRPARLATGGRDHGILRRALTRLPRSGRGRDDVARRFPGAHRFYAVGRVGGTESGRRRKRSAGLETRKHSSYTHSEGQAQTLAEWAAALLAIPAQTIPEPESPAPSN